MTVIGGQHGDAGLFFQAKKIFMDTVLELQPLVLYLKKEIFRPEYLAEKAGSGAGGIVLPFGEEFRDFTLEASGEPNQSFGVLRQKLLADARLVIKAIHRSL